MEPLVIYHANCADGFTAAWVIWKKHPDWEFYPAKHGEAPPDVTDREVYMVDFSYKQDVLEKMLDVCKMMVILDHHKTAMNDLHHLSITRKDKLWIHFDMEKSGAKLAWEYFNPEPNSVPDIISYVEDRDLWRFNYSATRDISSYIFSHPYDFETWNMIEEHIDNYHEDVIIQGQAIDRQHFKDVDELAGNAFRAYIGGYSVPVVNVPYTLASDMCHKLCKNEPFAASYYYDGSRDKFIFSLRSTTDAGVDVGEIAKMYGGGGHVHAAGFEVNGHDLITGLSTIRINKEIN